MTRQEQKLFQRALQEVETKIYVPKILKRAKIDTGSEDPEKINARYLELRFEQLNDQFADLLEEKRKAKAAQKKHAERVDSDRAREAAIADRLKKEARAEDGLNDYLCIAIIVVFLATSIFLFNALVDPPDGQDGAETLGVAK
jgi:ATP/maltotriose-dependent transcriptional regulator MalT